MKTKTQKYLMKIAIVGIFAAIAYVLSLFPKFNIFPVAPWLDVDLSDAPALLVAFALDPISGFLVVLIKSVLHLSASSTAFVGLAANLITGGSLVLVAGLVKMLLDRSRAVKFSGPIGAVAAIPPQVGCAVVANVYILLPAYGIDAVEKFGSVGAYVAIVVGHNLIKDALSCVIAVMLYIVLRPQINRYVPQYGYSNR